MKASPSGMPARRVLETKVNIARNSSSQATLPSEEEAVLAGATSSSPAGVTTSTQCRTPGKGFGADLRNHKHIHLTKEEL